jgi:hypothetical protein
MVDEGIREQHRLDLINIVDPGFSERLALRELDERESSFGTVTPSSQRIIDGLSQIRNMSRDERVGEREMNRLIAVEREREREQEQLRQNMQSPGRVFGNPQDVHGHCACSARRESVTF